MRAVADAYKELTSHNLHFYCMQMSQFDFKLEEFIV